MSKGIEKYRMEERIRRSFFKNRGDINAIIKETGLEPRFIRSICRKIQKGFTRDINFQTACFISDAILSGREQRLAILEDQLRELKEKELRSVCHGAPISVHEYEGTSWYKCKRCGENCETFESDNCSTGDFVKIVDRMRKEDELIGKFLAAIGLVAGAESSQEILPNTRPVQSTPVSDETHPSLPPADQKLQEKLKQLGPEKLAEIRRLVQSKVEEEIDGTPEQG